MDATASVILVVEEDTPGRTFLADNLGADGYQVYTADSRSWALAQLDARRPDLVICDLSAATLELVDAVRSADGVASRIDPHTPLIVLSARSDELHRVRCFDRGADDVVSKPYSYPELLRRVRAVLRRAHGRPRGGALRVGPVAVDPATREVRLRGEPIDVSKTEFALLHALASEPTRVFTKEELLRDVWGFRSRGATRTLDAHACRLRQKLARHGDRLVINVWGVGYRLIDSSVAA